jgi:hypothetical protein
LVDVDIIRVAHGLLPDHTFERLQADDPIRVTKNETLWRFGVLDAEGVNDPDRLHILVDGCGGFTAILDPDTEHAHKRTGTLAEFETAITRVSGPA